MGYRMTICPEGNHDDWVGDDHKFYGYRTYKEIKGSFDYLFERLKRQDTAYNDYDAEEASEFCCVTSLETILSEDEFAEFMELYLADLYKAWSKDYPDDYEENIARIRGYMTKMRDTPGNKVLYWA